MNTKEYNGWTNYETWLLKLWMDNDQGSQEEVYQWARSALESAELDDRPMFTKEEKAALMLSAQLKDEYESAAAGLVGVTGFWQDLLSSALSEVNWMEIAKYLIEEVEND